MYAPLENNDEDVTPASENLAEARVKAQGTEEAIARTRQGDAMHTAGALFCLAFFLTLCGPLRVESACQDHPVARGLLTLAYAAEADAIIQYFGHN